MEFLLRVKDRRSLDPAKDAVLSKAGHLIVCRPDGWHWSGYERKNPVWRIIRVDGFTDEEACKLTHANGGSEFADFQEAKKLDLSLAKGTVKTDFEDDLRTNAIIEISRVDFDGM